MNRYREVISWDEYYMGQAHAISKRSKDPSTQVGCVLVTKDNNPISQGYNGFPKGCDESLYTWEKPMKYHLVIHAEMNARSFVRNRDDLKGAKAYVTHHPCDNCLKHLIQDGVTEFIYDDEAIFWRLSEDAQNAIRIMVNANNIVLRKFDYRESE